MSALKSTRSDRNRIQASSLAAREIEITRNEFNASLGAREPAAADYVVDGHPLPGGTAGSALVVDKTPYTVIRDVEPLVAGTGVSPCDGGGAVDYPQFQVTVTVSWSPMAGVQPVKNTTMLTPPKGIISSTFGYVAVKVQDSAGTAKLGAWSPSLAPAVRHGHHRSRRMRRVPRGDARHLHRLPERLWLRRRLLHPEPTKSTPVTAGALSSSSVHVRQEGPPGRHPVH